MIDLMALAAIDRETEVTYIRRERDWAERGRGRGPAARPGAAAPDAAGDDRRAAVRQRQRARARQRARPLDHGHGAGTALLGSGHE